MSGLLERGPPPPERRPRLHFGSGTAIDAVLHACPFRGRAWSGCPRPMRRSWLRRNRLKPFGDEQSPKGFLAFAFQNTPISLVKLRSGGLGHIKREDSRAGFARLSLLGFWLMVGIRPFFAPTRCLDHAAEFSQLPHRSHPAAKRIVPTAVVRSAGAVSPGPTIGNASPMPGAVAV